MCVPNVGAVYLQSDRATVILLMFKQHHNESEETDEIEQAIPIDEPFRRFIEEF